MRLRDFLKRFRPAETPGASATGVSADRTAERAAELEPALAQLTDVRQEAAPIRAAADEAAKAVHRMRRRRLAELVAATREPEIRRRAAGQASIEVQWDTLMGVRHPAAVVRTDPARSPAEPTPSSTALAHAETAYRATIRAAAEHTARKAAAELLASEAARTRQRVRALRRHWIPRLRRELAAMELALDGAEYEEAVRRRWAAAHGAR
ncbi:V-type ATP synthase subunit D [Streptomyces mirabilis]|uniref:V-type ATP synthase subunit D n=1 Tax=Streptomyces TaxID=1883 RepID=UPI0029BEB16A|nr:V-type ATP synthase subunit D [Streptomyces sp. AK02-04a]MDX3758599.1 V-type ATP synthase subunit D [Streptomyces sp. AK02-04a]